MVDLTSTSLSLSPSLDANIAQEPLRDMAAKMSAASSSSVTLSTVTELGQINLRCDGSNGVLLQNIRKTLGIALPQKPNTSHTNRHLTTLWLGPDEWLILCPLRDVEQFVETLAKTCTNRHAAITDVSDNRTILALTGPQARQVLQKGCTLDLHPSKWQPEDCAQTLYMRSQIILQMRDDAPAFWLFVRPSFGAYLAQSLIEAMAQFSNEAG